ncbi:XrtA/PEP-CTERM system TPR-repeat protein PrsT [Agarivorans sp. QJM3NY_33]|uniref:XrtA/PEP-CTERM system TPR-repeat protein PrsT n=1 Tax=Agarivorans sp. QJM3NY_33 TaxID=3421432 RepID=UPI003D7CA103
MSNHQFGMKKLLVLGALSLSLVACGGDSAQEHLTKATNYLAQGDNSAAIIELKNAIKKDGELGQARLSLGRIYLNRGSYPAAQKELLKALALNADKAQVLPLLARSYLNQNQADKISTLIPDNRPLEADVETELLAIYALSLFREGQIDKARLTLNQAQELGVENTYSRMASASISAADKQYDQANSTIDQLAQEAPNNTDVWLLKGHLATLSNDIETAVAAYRHAVELAPDAIQFTLYLAQALVKNKQYSEAEPYLNRILKMAPNHILSNQLKAYIQFQKEDFDSAFTLATKALQNGSNNTSTQLIAGISAYKLNKYEQALTQLEKVITKDPGNALAQRLYVTTQFRIGQLDSALEQLNQSSLTDAQDSNFLSTVSIQLNQLGRTEEALQIAEKAAASGNLSAKAKLGLLQLKQNDPKGLETLNQVLAENPAQTQAFLGIQAFHYKQKKTDEVFAALEQWLGEHPKDQAVKLYKGALLEQLGRYQEALDAYQSVLKDNPKDVPATLFSSSAYVQIGKAEKAYQIIYQLKTENPENLRVFQFLMGHASQLDRMAEVKALLDQQLLEQPNSNLLQEQLGRYFVFKKDFKQAITSLEQVEPLLRSDQIWQLIGDLYLQDKQNDNAISTYRRWLDNSPLSLAAYIKNINVLEANNKLNEAVALSNRAVKVFKNNQKMIFLNSVLLLKTGNAAASQEALNSLAPNQLKTLAAIQQQGYIYLTQENLPLAIKTFEDLYSKHPSMQTANRLIQTYKDANQPERAVAFVEKTLSEHGEAAQPLQLQLAELQMSLNPQQALQSYQKIISKEPENIIALNNLAWVYHAQQDNQQALKYAKQVYQLKPELAQIKDTYGYMLLKAGQAEKATEILAESYQQQANNEIGVHYVEALIASNKHSQARTLLNSLIDLDPALLNKKAELEAQLK